MRAGRAGESSRRLAGVLLVVAGLAGGCAAPADGSSPLYYPYPPAASNLPRPAADVLAAAAAAYAQVTIYAEAGRRRAGSRQIVNGASAIVVDPRGYLVTAAHIAKRVGHRASVRLLDGRRYEAVVARIAPRCDLALLRLLGPPARMAAAAAAASPRAGQAVFAIGAPSNRPGAVSLGRLTASAPGRQVRYGDYGFDDALTLDLPVEPGFSGGPLYDAQGRLLGMIASFGFRGGGVARPWPPRTAFAVPAGTIAAFLSAAPGDAGKASSLERVADVSCGEVGPSPS